MDVSGVNTGPPGAHFPSAPSGVPGSKPEARGESLGRSGDAITGILGQLSEPEAVSFLENILLPLPPADAARIEDLLHAAVSAAADGNVQQALLKLSELTALDPGRGGTLVQEPGLAPIRQEVGQLLSRLTSAAHMDAESKLAEATRLLGTADAREIPEGGVRPEAAVLIAERLLEAGGYSNYVRSAEVSQFAINQYAIAQPPAPLSPVEARSIPAGVESTRLRARPRWLPRLKMLWQRAPLLVLLLAWLALGIAATLLPAWLKISWLPASIGFEIWATGFLALVVFGFYMRVRNIR